MTGGLTVYVGNWIEQKMRVDDVVGAVAVHGFAGFMGMHLGRRLRSRVPDGARTTWTASIWGQLLGLAVFVPLGFLSG